jgi:hypothetical protein
VQESATAKSNIYAALMKASLHVLRSLLSFTETYSQQHGTIFINQINAVEQKSSALALKQQHVFVFQIQSWLYRNTKTSWAPICIHAGHSLALMLLPM